MLFLRVFVCSLLITYISLDSYAASCLHGLQRSNFFKSSALSKTITLFAHNTYMPQKGPIPFVTKRHLSLKNNFKGFIEHVQLRAVDNDIPKQMRREIIKFEDFYNNRQTQSVYNFLHNYMLKTQDFNPSFYYTYRVAALTSALTKSCDHIHDYMHDEPCVTYALMIINFARTHNLDVIQPYQSVKILHNNLAQLNFTRCFVCKATPQQFTDSWQIESGKNLQHLLRISFALCKARETQAYVIKSNDFYDVLKSTEQKIKETSSGLLAVRSEYYAHLMNFQISTSSDSFYNMVKANEFEMIQKETQRRLDALEELKDYFEFCLF